MTLSVIMPNYNHAKYLPEALEAILSQSYPAMEIVFVDDASQDESIMLIESYRMRYPQIKLYYNERNLGPVATINRAVEYATGEYLAFCSADDRVLPGFFEAGVTFLQNHPEVGLCTSSPRYFKEDGTYRDEGCKLKERVILPSELAEILRAMSFSIPSHTSIYRRDCVVKYGMLDSELKMVSDFYMNYRIAFHTAIGYIPKTLASLRQREGSYSAKLFKDKKQREQIFQKICEKIAHEPKPIRTYFRNSGLLSRFGLKMFLFLMKTPRFWPHLFPVLQSRLIRYAKQS